MLQGLQFFWLKDNEVVVDVLAGETVDIMCRLLFRTNLKYSINENEYKSIKKQYSCKLLNY